MPDKDLDLKAALAAHLADRARSAGDHPEAEELVAYHEGELTSEQEEKLQEHLLACRECGDLLLELERIEREEREAAAKESASPAEAAGPRRVLRFPWQRQRPAASRATPMAPWLGWVAAAAAAVLLLVVLPEGSVAPLGSYTLSVQGEIQETRGPGEDPEVYRFAPGLDLEILLRPQRPVEGRLGVRTYLSHEGRTDPWFAPVEISKEGSVRIAGAVDDQIVIPPGRSDLLVAIGRRRRIPAPEELERLLAETASAQEHDWAAWKVAVSFEEAGAVP